MGSAVFFRRVGEFWSHCLPTLLLFSLYGIGTTTFIAVSGCYPAARAVLDLPPFTSHAGKHNTFQVVMRDGVLLNTDVYFPDGEGPWPAVLLRTPYNMMGSMNTLAELLSHYGYVGIHQDVRGRFRSGGEWYPINHERDDTLDCVGWMLEQPWQNRKVGLMGASYFAATIWMAADALPPEVKTIVPMIFGTDLQGVVYEKGLFRQDVFTMWAALMNDHGMHLFHGREYKKARRHFPMLEADAAFFGGELPWFRQWLSSPAPTSPLWLQPLNSALRTMPERVSIPVMMVGGWYDIFTESQIADFQHLASKEQSRFLMGPWNHLLGSSHNGDLDLPTAGTLADHFGKVINWLDHHLKGAALDATWGPFDSYVIGEGRWEHYSSWPPATDTKQFWLLAPASEAAGRLEEANEHVSSSQEYTYDPQNPVPTVGGGGTLAFVFPTWGGAPPSIQKQPKTGYRSDVLSFVSEPLANSMRITGKVIFNLLVASDAPDTAFTAKLIDVFPGGKAYNIVDTASTLVYRNDSPEKLAYTPGEKVRLRLDAWPIEWSIASGHRLRVDISSSNFPMYHLHANRAEEWATVTMPQRAHQRLYLGGNESSTVDIPVKKGTEHVRAARTEIAH